MAFYRTLSMDFLSDPYIESLNHVGKLLYLCLLINKHTNNLGVLEITPKRMSMECDLPEEQVSTWLERFEADGKIIRDGYTIFLTKFVKHQATQSPKLLIGLARLLCKVQSDIIRKAIICLYPAILNETATAQASSSYGNQNHTAARPYPASTSRAGDRVSIPSVEQEVEEEKKKEDCPSYYNARDIGKSSPMPHRANPYAVLPARHGASVKPPAAPSPSRHSSMPTSCSNAYSAGQLALEFKTLRDFYNEHIRREGFVDGYREFMSARCCKEDLPDMNTLQAAIQRLGTECSRRTSPPLLADFLREQLWKEKAQVQAPMAHAEPAPNTDDTERHPASALVRTLGNGLHSGIHNLFTPPAPVLVGA